MDQDDKNNEGMDLSGALKDSDTGVEFKEYRAEHSYYPHTPKIIQLVIEYSGGLIKDEKQASYVLLTTIILAILISIFLFLNTLSGPQIPPGALEQPEYGLPIKD